MEWSAIKLVAENVLKTLNEIRALYAYKNIYYYNVKQIFPCKNTSWSFILIVFTNSFTNAS